MTDQSQFIDPCRPKEDRVLNYIRTLWPIAATAVALFMAYASLEARVTRLEDTVCELRDAVVGLHESQAETNTQLAVLANSMGNLVYNTERMLSAWPGGVPSIHGGE